MAKIERFDDLLDAPQNFRGALQAIQTIGSGDGLDQSFSSGSRLQGFSLEMAEIKPSAREAF